MRLVTELESGYVKITDPEDITREKLREFFVEIKKNISGIVGYMTRLDSDHIQMAVEGWGWSVGDIGTGKKHRGDKTTFAYTVSNVYGDVRYSKHLNVSVRNASKLLVRGSLITQSKMYSNRFNDVVSKEVRELGTDVVKKLESVFSGLELRYPNIGSKEVIEALDRMTEISSAGFVSTNGDFNTKLRELVALRAEHNSMAVGLGGKFMGWFVFWDNTLLDGSKVCVVPVDATYSGYEYTDEFCDHMREIEPYMTSNGIVLTQETLPQDVYHKVAALNMLQQENKYIKDVGYRIGGNLFIVHADTPAWEHKEWLSNFGS